MYSKILSCVQEYDKAQDIVTQGLERCGENGDLYYIMAKILKEKGDIEGCRKNLSLCLKYFKSLTVPVNVINKALKGI